MLLEKLVFDISDPGYREWHETDGESHCTVTPYDKAQAEIAALTLQVTGLTTQHESNKAIIAKQAKAITRLEQERDEARAAGDRIGAPVSKEEGEECRKYYLDPENFTEYGTDCDSDFAGTIERFLAARKQKEGM